MDRPGWTAGLAAPIDVGADPLHGDVEVLDVEHETPQRRRALGSPARSTTSTISPPPPTRWKPWRISPTSRTRFSGAPVASAIAAARALQRVRDDDDVVEPDRPDRVLDEHRCGRRDDLGRHAVDRRHRLRSRPDSAQPTRPGSTRRVDADPGAEQRDRAVDDGEPEAVPRLDRAADRSTTRRAPSRRLPRIEADLPGEERQAVGQLVGPLGDRLADAVAGPALLEQQDRALVLARRAACSSAAILRACSGSTRVSPSAVVNSVAG